MTFAKDKFRLHRKQVVIVTNNMRGILYGLLTSLSYKDGKASVVFDKEVQELMDTFQFEDVVDCHTRLDLPDCYGPGVSKKAKAYVLDKILNGRYNDKRDTKTC